VIVPRGEVPEDLSPAAIRVVRLGKHDARALAATVVQMAIKGYLVIEERGGKFTLRRGQVGRAALTPEEALVANDLNLERVEQIGIESANHVQVGAAVNGLKNFLRASLERFYLLRNREFLFPGVALSVIVLGSTLTLEPGLRSFTRGLIAVLLFFWTVAVSLLIFQIEYRWHDVFLHRGPRRDTLFHAASITVFAIPFLIAEIVGLGLIIWLGSYSYGVVLLGVAFLNVHFHYLFKAPASAGRRLLDRIEGFEIWLAAAEADGMSRFGPELTPEVYEKFLPYAIALNHEEQWSRQCAAVLAHTGEGGRGYRPAWFQSESAGGEGGPAPRAGGVGDSLCAAIVSSAAAPVLNRPSAVTR
jgi:type IV secretory pathway TrbD component